VFSPEGIYGTAEQAAAERWLLPVERGPQRLQPVLFSIDYIRPEGRTHQNIAFFAAYEAVPFQMIRALTELWTADPKWLAMN
jgi:hypothetical protein